MKALIKSYNPKAIIVDLLEVLQLEGRNLLIMPTFVQNALRSDLPDVEFGNMADTSFRSRIETAKSTALPPSVTEQGFRLQDWDRVLFVECTFHPNTKGREIGFNSPAAKTLLSALIPREGRVAPECHIYSELNLGDVSEALGHLKETRFSDLEIEIISRV